MDTEPQNVHTTKPSPENPQTTKTWSYEQFKAYLLSDNSVSPEQLPQTIEINDDWHTSIGTIVQNTVRDGVEWGFAVHKAIKQGETDPSLFLFGPKKGTKESIDLPRIRIWEDEKFAKKNNLSSKSNQIGSIHTHPTNNPLWTMDLYSMLMVRDQKIQLVAVKDGNFIAIRTKSTPEYEERKSEEMNVLFDELVKRGNEFNDVEESKGQEWSSTVYSTQKVCQDYNIGLYYGKPGEPLNRLR